jgi:hypothetical protein
MILGKSFVLGAVMCVAPALAAQARPDFSGHWARIEDSATARRPTIAAAGDVAFRVGDMGTGWGTDASPLTITQRPDSLIVEYVFFAPYDLQPPVRLAYAMNGGASVNHVMIGHATSTQRARLAWSGSSLVVTTDVPLPREVGSTTTVRQTLTLESPASLVIETWRAGVAGSAPTTLTTRYTRAPAAAPTRR